MNSIDEVLDRRAVIITCGTGGVGKTTVSAALALRAALRGKRTAVITIDPAKRLATSLGIKHVGNEPVDLTARLAQAYGQPVRGSIVAIMPDTRQTFEAFVRELSPDAGVAERVMRNPIFQVFAKEFSGTNEYMALEKLDALVRGGKYDCIVLDTPPSRNTLAFLEAPQVLAQFFDEKIIRWLVLPANKIMATGMKKAFGLLERLTGSGFMSHLFDFAQAMFEVRVRFSASLNRVMALLKSERVGFIMVTVLSPETTPEALQFAEVIRRHEFHFDGVIINRRLMFPEPGAETPEGAAAETDPALTVVRAMREREARVMHALEKNPISVRASLPELSRDVHSVEDLLHVALALDPAAIV